MTAKEARDLKEELKQSDYVEKRSIKVRRYGSAYVVEFSEGGCGYSVESLDDAAALGFHKV